MGWQFYNIAFISFHFKHLLTACLLPSKENQRYDGDCFLVFDVRCAFGVAVMSGNSSNLRICVLQHLFFIQLYSHSKMAITNSTSIPKPKAPLNEYNLFFLLERKRILDCKEEQDLVDYAEEELSTIIQEHKTRGRRQHRRVHGRISFRELARTIASRWKQLDMTQRSIFERRARIERVEYQARLQQWEAAVAQQTANESPRDTHIQYLQDAYAQVESEDPTSRLQQLQALQASIEAEMARTISFYSPGCILYRNRSNFVCLFMSRKIRVFD